MNTTIRNVSKKISVGGLILLLLAGSFAFAQTVDTDMVERECANVKNGALVSPDKKLYVECFDGKILQPIGGGVAQTITAYEDAGDVKGLKSKLVNLYGSTAVRENMKFTFVATTASDIEPIEKDGYAFIRLALIALLTILGIWEVKKDMRKIEVE